MVSGSLETAFNLLTV